MLMAKDGRAGAWATVCLDNEDVSAPHLLDAEVGQAIRRLTLGGELTVTREEFAEGLGGSADRQIPACRSAPQGLHVTVECDHL